MSNRFYDKETKTFADDDGQLFLDIRVGNRGYVPVHKLPIGCYAQYGEYYDVTLAGTEMPIDDIAELIKDGIVTPISC